jgi:uncharacterized cupin superfamily protein
VAYHPAGDRAQGVHRRPHHPGAAPHLAGAHARAAFASARADRYILDGTVDFHIGDEVVRLGPGGLAVVPPNVMHHAVLVGDKPALNLDVFAPSRPDYVA